MKPFRIFGGKPFQLKPRKKEAKRRRKKGQKVRIVQNQSVKWYGGDIAFFLYSDKIKERNKK